MTHKIEQSIKLRDGGTAEDPRLGRLVQYDERSKDYDVADVFGTADVLRNHWWGLHWLRLNQANTSACTGESETYDLFADPQSVKTVHGMQVNTQEFAQYLYSQAKKYDEWPGEDYEGSSVLGAAKAATHLGLIGEYRWAFNIDDALKALSVLGGLVVGTNWYNSMFDPRPSGLIEVDPSSGVAGGHAWFICGISVTEQSKRNYLGSKETIRPVPLLHVAQSWGEEWGDGGFGRIWADDLEVLHKDDGEIRVTTKAFHL